MSKIERFSKHAIQRIAEYLKGMTEEEFWEILRKADDPEDKSVRWTTKNIKDRRPDQYRLYIESIKKSLTLVIKEGVLITIIDPSIKKTRDPNLDQRYDTIIRYLENNDLPYMSIKSLKRFEEIISSFSSKKIKRYRISKKLYRFPVESKGVKFFIFYSFKNGKIFAPCCPNIGVNIFHELTPMFYYRN